MSNRMRLAALLAASVVGLIGCSQESDRADSSTNGAAAPSSTAPATSDAEVSDPPADPTAGDTSAEGSDPSDPAVPDVPADPAAFDSTFSAANERLAGSTDDFCTLADDTQTIGAISQPTNPDQARQLFVLFGSSLKRLAAAAPSTQSGDVEVISAAADQLLADAEAGGFDPATFNLGGELDALSAQPVQAAMSRLDSAIVAECGNDR